MRVVSLELEKIRTGLGQYRGVLLAFHLCEKLIAMFLERVREDLLGVLYFEAGGLKHSHVDRVTYHLIIQVGDLVAADHALKEFHRGKVLDFLVLILAAERGVAALVDVIREHIEFSRDPTSKLPDARSYSENLDAIFCKRACFVKDHESDSPGNVDFPRGNAEDALLLQAIERISCSDGHGGWKSRRYSDGDKDQAMQDEVFLRIALLHKGLDGNQEADKGEYCKDNNVE
jgi:hypothetical protein